MCGAVVCMYVRLCLFPFHFSALSITYSNPHTKACYFIIKHVLCVLATLFLSLSSSLSLSLRLSTYTLSLTSRENIFIFVCRAKACARVYSFFFFVFPFFYSCNNFYMSMRGIIFHDGFSECAQCTGLESVSVVHFVFLRSSALLFLFRSLCTWNFDPFFFLSILLLSFFLPLP